MKTVGEILRKTRKKRGYTLLEVSKELKIQPKFLKALERGEYDAFGHSLHIKGFLKNYADFLDLNVEEVLAFWRREYQESEAAEDIHDVTNPLRKPRFAINPSNLVTSITILLVLGFLGYLFFQYRSIAGPPKLEVTSPSKDLVTSEPQLTLKGKADPQATLTINGQEVVVSDEGNFAFDYVLSDGPNALKFTAVNEFGRETEINRSVIYEPPRVEPVPVRESSPSAEVKQATPSAGVNREDTRNPEE